MIKIKKHQYANEDVVYNEYDKMFKKNDVNVTINGVTYENMNVIYYIQNGWKDKSDMILYDKSVFIFAAEAQKTKAAYNYSSEFVVIQHMNPINKKVFLVDPAVDEKIAAYIIEFDNEISNRGKDGIFIAGNKELTYLNADILDEKTHEGVRVLYFKPHERKEKKAKNEIESNETSETDFVVHHFTEFFSVYLKSIEEFDEEFLDDNDETFEKHHKGDISNIEPTVILVGSPDGEDLEIESLVIVKNNVKIKATGYGLTDDSSIIMKGSNSYLEIRNEPYEIEKNEQYWKDNKEKIKEIEEKYNCRIEHILVHM